MAKMTNYLTQQYMQSLQQQQQQRQHLARNGSAGPVSSGKPVTVRSVKRRDKAKAEEKRMHTDGNGGGAHHVLRNALETREEEERKAVMV